MKKNPGKPRLPWVTKDGYLDLAKLPIDSILKQGLSLDISQFRSACRLLTTMEAHGRKEAGVYLVGLFYRFRDDLERLITIVEQLPEDTQSVEILVSELYRVMSTNSTRRYLSTVIKTLARYPRQLTEEHFERLCKDKALSPRMRAKFKAILNELVYEPGNDWA